MSTHAILVALALPLTAAPQIDEERAETVLSESLGGLIGTWQETETDEGSQNGATKMSFRWSAGRKVVLWEGTFAAKEATWSFVAAIFFDPYKDNLRVFAFNSHGRRHMGLLAKLAPGKLAWKMSGLRPDGRRERFVAEFVQDGDDKLVFSIKDRRPADEVADGDVTVKLRRTAGSKQGARK